MNDKEEQHPNEKKELGIFTLLVIVFIMFVISLALVAGANQRIDDLQQQLNESRLQSSQNLQDHQILADKIDKNFLNTNNKILQLWEKSWATANGTKAVQDYINMTNTSLACLGSVMDFEIFIRQKYDNIRYYFIMGNDTYSVESMPPFDPAIECGVQSKNTGLFAVVNCSTICKSSFGGVQ